ncbi:MAG: hypothetical protein ACXWQ5_00950 [Ktedonobacterales bacterium]
MAETDPLIPFTGAWASVVTDTEDTLFQSRSITIQCACGLRIGMAWIAPLVLVPFYTSIALTLFCPACGKLYSIFQNKDRVEEVSIFNI